MPFGSNASDGSPPPHFGSCCGAVNSSACALPAKANAATRTVSSTPRPSTGGSLRADEDRRPQWYALHQRFQILGLGVQAPGRQGHADRCRVVRAVDREPVTTAPAGGRVGLVAGQREDAAAVVRAVVAARKLVRDGEAAGRRWRAGPADAYGGRAHDAAAVDELEALAREVDTDRQTSAALGHEALLRLDPPELA